MSDTSSVRVVNFVLDPRMGGPHVYIAAIKRGLGDGIESILVTAGFAPEAQLNLCNLRHRWPLLYGVEILCNVVLILWHVARKRISARGAVFAVHGVANLAPLIAARILRVPVVWYLHETWNRLRGFAWVGRRIVHRGRHRIVSVSRQAFASAGVEADAVLVPPIDLGFWSARPQVGGENKSESRGISILAVGNINPLKGHDLLLDALAHYELPFELKIAGAVLENRRDYHRSLLAKAAEISDAGPERRIELIGWKDSREIRALLEACDVFVLPSRSEASPIALLEAMAMERVCIASDVGGVREIIDDARLGIVIPPERAEHLRAALRRVAAMSGAEKRQMGLLARAKVERDNSIEQAARIHLAMYQMLLATEADGVV